MPRPRQSPRWLHAAAAAAATLALLSACSSSSGSNDGAAASGHGDASATSESVTTTTLAPVSLAATPAAGTTGVPLDRPIQVTADGGTLNRVVARPVTAAAAPASAGGSTTSTSADPPAVGASTPIAGTLSADHRSWVSAATLEPNTTYQVTAVADGSATRGAAKQQWTFTTLSPTSELHTRLNVFEGHTYGVGMPIVVQLTHPVPDAKKAAVTQRLKVTTSPGIQGAWHWFTDSEVHWRPASYWPAHTAATLAVDFAGLDVGNGVWGVDGRTVHFNIGDSHISIVDANTHQMTTTVNGAVVKTTPVSTGRDKYPTKSGIHVVNEKEATKIMDSATVGIPRNSPDGYYETVHWDVRISNSGEFVHAAPWSTGSQGNSNVSHGCVNVSDADGQWFFGFTQLGDVVQVVNTPDQLQPWNGYGDWQIPWSQWV